MLRKLILLPARLALLPLILLLQVFHFICAILLGLSSLVTNILATVFITGSVAGWLCHAPSNAIWQAVGIGIFFAVAPSVAEWMLGRVTDLTIWLIGFAFSK